jgi:hypothetical protein
MIAAETKVREACRAGTRGALLDYVRSHDPLPATVLRFVRKHDMAVIMLER